MGSKYPILPPDKIIKALEKTGFQKAPQKGSHAKYETT
ncbi:MAG: type II toxin-antitoxin system HicA family toxin [Natronincolaceae bacterium]|jgi:predicted RNA binding protein YcfA (HicA-like mRNA interferase family)|nr:type II toxin-antitoxin system HicA family toxin [Bacillota bacterium]NLK90568.1 addiction module toxin, HicA family [Clostridiales bacterium]